MLEQIREFKSFVTGHEACFCCEDCDQAEDCLTLYHARKMLESLEATELKDISQLPEETVAAMTHLFEQLQECAWQRCDCRTRY